MSRHAECIVAPAIDIAELARSITRGLIEYNDGERALQAAEQKTESLRETQARRRLELGRQLIEARRGVPHGGWEAYVAKLGFEARTATNWMREAGYVDGHSKTESSAALDSDLNTRIAAGIDKRPRKRDEEPDPPLREPPISKAPALDVSGELSRFHDKICEFAERVPDKWRAVIAAQLRETARLIEEMG